MRQVSRRISGHSSAGSTFTLTESTASDFLSLPSASMIDHSSPDRTSRLLPFADTWNDETLAATSVAFFESKSQLLSALSPPPSADSIKSSLSFEQRSDP